MYFLKIPFDVFVLITEYCSYSDIKKFLLTNSKIRKDYLYLKLKNENSQKFLSNSNFQDYISQLINFDFKKLSLVSKTFDTKTTFDFSKIYSVTIYDCNIADLSAISSCSNIQLGFCHKLVDVKPFANCHKLVINCCHNITDFSPLRNCPILKIFACHDLKDVSALGKQEFLSIDYCNKLKDVSALGTCKTLILSNCSNIEDVSKLGNCPNLKIKYCNKITDVSGLAKCEKLKILNCAAIKPETLLPLYTGVKNLQIHSCKGVDDFKTSVF